jgi:uncharacterized protein YutE (UPF0331/DUF86 family)
VIVDGRTKNGYSLSRARRSEKAMTKINEEEIASLLRTYRFRNRIVHFYNDIDLKILYETLGEELVHIRELYRTLS